MTSSLTKELRELADIAGYPTDDVPQVSRAGLAVATLVLDLRGLLNEAVVETGIGVRGLARKLGISAAAVSRHLRSEGDIKASTAAVIADALDRDFVVSLKPRHIPYPGDNKALTHQSGTLVSAPSGITVSGAATVISARQETITQ